MLGTACYIVLGLVAFPYVLADAPIPLPQRLLHQFPDGVWVENIHVRPNGNLLVGALTLNWKLRTGGSFRIDNRFVLLCRADENEVNEK